MTKKRKRQPPAVPRRSTRQRRAPPPPYSPPVAPAAPAPRAPPPVAAPAPVQVRFLPRRRRPLNAATPAAPRPPAPPPAPPLQRAAPAPPPAPPAPPRRPQLPDVRRSTRPRVPARPYSPPLRRAAPAPPRRAAPAPAPAAPAAPLVGAPAGGYRRRRRPFIAPASDAAPAPRARGGRRPKKTQREKARDKRIEELRQKGSNITQLEAIELTKLRYDKAAEESTSRHETFVAEQEYEDGMFELGETGEAGPGLPRLPRGHFAAPTTPPSPPTPPMTFTIPPPPPPPAAGTLVGAPPPPPAPIPPPPVVPPAAAPALLAAAPAAAAPPPPPAPPIAPAVLAAIAPAPAPALPPLPPPPPTPAYIPPAIAIPTAAAMAYAAAHIPGHLQALVPAPGGPVAMPLAHLTAHLTGVGNAPPFLAPPPMAAGFLNMLTQQLAAVHPTLPPPIPVAPPPPVPPAAALAAVIAAIMATETQRNVRYIGVTIMSLEYDCALLMPPVGHLADPIYTTIRNVIQNAIANIITIDPIANDPLTLYRVACQVQDINTMETRWIATPFARFPRVRSLMIAMLNDTNDIYSFGANDRIIKISVGVSAPNVVRGRTIKGYDLSRYLGGVSEKRANETWFRINTNTTSNCFWVALAVAKNWKKNPELLLNPVVRQQAAVNLKKKVDEAGELEDANYVQHEHFQKYADFTRATIIVYNNLFVKKALFEPKKLTPEEVENYPLSRLPDKFECHMLLINSHVEVLLKQSEVLAFQKQQELAGKDTTRLRMVWEFPDKETFVKVVAFVEMKVDFQIYGKTKLNYPVVLLKDGYYAVIDEHDEFKGTTFYGLEEIDIWCKENRWKFTNLDTQTSLIDKRSFQIISDRKGNLKPLYERPSRIASYDIESCPAQHDPKGIHRSVLLGLGFFGQAPDHFRQYNEKESRDFNRPQFIVFERDVDDNPVAKFFEHLYKYRHYYNDFTFYGHNAGRFDAVFLLNEYLLDNNDKWFIQSITETDSSIICIKLIAVEGDVKNRNIRLTFLDSVKVAPLSLDGLGAALKTKNRKLTGSVDLGKLTMENFHYFRDDLVHYLKFDCLTLAEAMIILADALYNDDQLNITKCLTGPSLGIKSFWKNYYNQDQMPIFNLGRAEDAYIRKSYFGGRTEAFTLGLIEGPSYYYDVNSMYPHVGRMDLPYGYPMWTKTLSYIVEDCKIFGHKLIDDFFGFIRVEVVSTNLDEDDNELPVFGFKNPEGRLLFPKFKEPVEITIFSEEMRYAQKNNMSYKFKVLDGIAFKKGPVMKNFFQDNYDKRLLAKKAGNLGEANIRKLKSNSTYGKLAQRTLNKDMITLYSPDRVGYLDKFHNEQLVSIRESKCYTLVRSKEDTEAVDINVAIAAAITSYARLELHKAITAVRDEGGLVHYCDTDSIITDTDIAENPTLRAILIPDGDGKTLGSMKNELPEKLDEALATGCFSKLTPEQKEEVKKEAARTGYAFQRAAVVMAKTYCLEFRMFDESLLATAFKGLSKKASKTGIQAYIDMVTGEVYNPYEDDGDEPTLVEERVTLEDGTVEKIFTMKQPSGQLQFVAGKRCLMSESIEDQGIRVLTIKKQFSMKYTKGAWCPELFKEGHMVQYVRPLKIGNTVQ